MFSVCCALNGGRSASARALYDGDSDSCWQSDELSARHTSHYATLTFACSSRVTAVELTCGGGFVLSPALVSVRAADDDKFVLVSTAELRDDNSAQRITLAAPTAATAIRIAANASTDLFGRVCLYEVRVLAQKLPADDDTADVAADAGAVKNIDG